MNEQKFYALYEVSCYGTAFKPVYIFPAMEEAKEAKRQLDVLYNKYNKFVSNRDCSNINLALYNSKVSCIMEVRGIGNWEIEKRMWRKQDVFAILEDVDQRVFLCDNQEEANSLLGSLKEKIRTCSFKSYKLSFDNYVKELKEKTHRLEYLLDDDEYI